jgi:hypothetical protein
MNPTDTCQWHAGTVSRPLKGQKAMTDNNMACVTCGHAYWEHNGQGCSHLTLYAVGHKFCSCTSFVVKTNPLRHHVSGATPDTVVRIRDFTSHTDALAGQETDRANGYRVGDWYTYQGVTSYTVTLPREMSSVKLEGES